MTLDVITIIIFILLAAAALVSYRLFAGPSIQDRLLSANAVSFIVVLALALYSHNEGVPLFLDIALAFVMLDFVGTIAYTKYLGKEGAS